MSPATTNLELVPLCELDVVLKEPLLVGEGPAGTRVIVEVESIELTSDRVRGHLKGNACADWLVLSGPVATLDVRATLETDDGALIFTQYRGRSDFSNGPGGAPLYVAPVFETGDPRYQWLNLVQAVGKGRLDGTNFHYDWYELR